MIERMGRGTQRPTTWFRRGVGHGGAPTLARFDGEICGFGTASGRRIVVGSWRLSPFGPFADVMVEDAEGHRTLYAPTDELCRYIAGIYAFDDARRADVRVARSPAALDVSAGPLRATVSIGRRDALGWALIAVPRWIASRRSWTAVTDPLARIALRGVRTRGHTPGGREDYLAFDRHRLTGVTATWDGTDIGPLRPVQPPVRFGFGSTPTVPSIVRLATIVEAASPRHATLAG
jgi:hypothetical protein